jgi:hypothetical protein
MRDWNSFPPGFQQDLNLPVKTAKISSIADVVGFIEKNQLFSES